VIELRDSVVVHASPERVWEWLETLPGHYQQWHPDHRSARWVTGHDFHPGAVMEVEEVLHGRPHRLTLTCVDVEPGRSVRYRLFPGMGGAFEIEPVDGGTRFTATLCAGTRAKVVGPALDAVLRRVLGGRFEALRRHQAEEGVNLKAVLEATRSAEDVGRG
jgi:uncharacterized protein YndB with AHSA1/START domain